MEKQRSGSAPKAQRRWSMLLPPALTGWSRSRSACCTATTWARWVDEDAPIDRYPMARGNLAAEASLCTDSRRRGGRPWVALGEFYGRAPPTASSCSPRLSPRRLVLGPPGSYVALIHVADAGAASLQLHAAAGTFNIVDDEPLTKREYADAMARAAGAAMWLRGPGRAALVFGDRAHLADPVAASATLDSWPRLDGRHAIPALVRAGSLLQRHSDSRRPTG